MIYRIVIFALISCTFALSCRSKKSAAAIPEESVSFDNLCHQDRMIVRLLKEQEASVLTIAGQYILATTETSRYFPCSLPAEFRKEGMKVLFSAHELKISPSERLIGTPIHIISLTSLP